MSAANWASDLLKADFAEFLHRANEPPKRIQLRRTKGWRLPPNTIKVDRTGWFGNPYLIDEHGTRPEVVEMFRAVIVGEREPDRVFTIKRLMIIRGALRHRLKGQNLACWCPLDEPCHADVLLQIANSDDPV